VPNRRRKGHGRRARPGPASGVAPAVAAAFALAVAVVGTAVGAVIERVVEAILGAVIETVVVAGVGAFPSPVGRKSSSISRYASPRISRGSASGPRITTEAT